MIRVQVCQNKGRSKTKTIKKSEIAGVVKHPKTGETILLLKKKRAFGRVREEYIYVSERYESIIQKLNYTPW